MHRRIRMRVQRHRQPNLPMTDTAFPRAAVVRGRRRGVGGFGL